MDAFLEGSDTSDSNLDTTPYIEFQLDKINDSEYINQKYIPEDALFISTIFREKLLKFYNSNLDMPLLIYGGKGVGKLTAILGLINHIPTYIPDINNDKKINNLLYIKPDTEYTKLFIYENLYYLSIKLLSSSTEIMQYLRYIYKLSKMRSFNIDEKKIVIINHIERCNDEAMRYINLILDKLNGFVSYIFITTRSNNITNKIKSTCARIHFDILTEHEFYKIFKYNYHTLNLTDKILKQYYIIYTNNNYNIGHTLNQIKYNLDTNKNDTNTLMFNICSKFIKNKLKLSNIANTIDIRKILYTLVSLNINLLEFCKMLVKQLLDYKINNKCKKLILEQVAILSHELTNFNKDIIIVENFIYKLITIIHDINT